MSSPRAAFTLAELLLVLTIVGVLLALAVPRLVGVADRIAVRGAAGDLAATFAFARQSAVLRRSSVAVALDTGRVRVAADDSVLLERSMRNVYGVTLRSSRDSMAYDARGLGFGAANLMVVVRRGRVVETLFVSRLGRVRR